jgi:hypothetical protein
VLLHLSRKKSKTFQIAQKWQKKSSIFSPKVLFLRVKILIFRAIYLDFPKRAKGQKGRRAEIE